MHKLPLHSPCNMCDAIKQFAFIHIGTLVHMWHIQAAKKQFCVNCPHEAVELKHSATAALLR